MTTIHTDPILHQASVLDEANHVVEVTIIRPGEAKIQCDGAQVLYTEQALMSSLPLWEAAACFCDHWDKSVRNIAGVFFSPWYDDGVKAKLRFIDDNLYNMVSRIVADRDEGLAVPDIGISADIAINGNTDEDERIFEVTEIARVVSADIVFSPAAGGSFDRILNSVMGDTAVADPPGIEDQQDEDQADAEPPPDVSDVSAPCANGQTPAPDKRVRDLQSTADKLRNQVRNQEAEITQLQDQLTEAVSHYRDEVLRQHPEIPSELVSGITVAEVDASLEMAKTLVDNVRHRLTDRVPAGAPARRGQDTTAMSPGEKISHGIQERKAAQK